MAGVNYDGSPLPDNPNPTAAPGGFDIMKFLSSPGGAAAIQAAGGAASAYGASQQAGAQLAQNASQFQANTTQAQSQQDRQNAVSALTPLGESQQFAGHNAILNSILPNMRNFNSPESGNAHGRGGMLPDGGLDASMINSHYGNAATLESLSQHAKQLSAINPSAPQENFANLGYSQEQADPFMKNVAGYQGQQIGKQNDQRALIQRALDNDLNGEKQKYKDDHSFWGQTKQVLGMAIPAALGVAGGYMAGR